MTKNISWEEEFDDRFYRLLSTKYKPHEFVTEEVRQFIREVRKQALADMLDVVARACKTQDFISIDKFLKMEGL